MFLYGVPSKLQALNLLRVLRYQPPDLNTLDWISELLRGYFSCLTRHSFTDGAEAANVRAMSRCSPKADKRGCGWFVR